jgi:hypothetical protein
VLGVGVKNYASGVLVSAGLRYKVQSLPPEIKFNRVNAGI